MEFSKILTDSEFDEMTWHNCRVYAMTFPSENFKVVFDIDYAYSWTEDNGFLVSPCQWTFSNVSNLDIRVSVGMALLLTINDVRRTNCGLSPNGKILLWNYQIYFNGGEISFVSSGFYMTADVPAKLTKNMDIGRDQVQINLC